MVHRHGDHVHAGYVEVQHARLACALKPKPRRVPHAVSRSLEIGVGLGGRGRHTATPLLAANSADPKGEIRKATTFEMKHMVHDNFGSALGIPSRPAAKRAVLPP